jgi:hypothetical protein
MKNALLLLITIAAVFSTLQSSAQGQVLGTQSTFKRQHALKLKELGKQCVLNSLEEFEVAKKTVSDPDLLISLSDFDRSIAFLGDHSSNFTPLYNESDLETQTFCFLNKKEVTALMMYSMSAYRKLNQALRDKNLQMLNSFKIYIKTLNSALDKIRNYEGFVKRGAGNNRDKFNDHQINAIVIYPSYTSTSVGRGFGGAIQEVIFSKTCKYIAPFSVATMEEEVLCKPGTEFKVLYRKDKKTVLHLILEEIGQHFDIDKILN